MRAQDVRTPGGNPVNAETNERADCCDAGPARQVADVIEGESYASAYLSLLHAGIAEPGELAVILSFLQGELLAGACRLIEKALESRSHA